MPKIGVFGSWWQSLVLLCQFWKMTHHFQNCHKTAKCCIPLGGGRIVGQFLHWNFEVKNSLFLQNQHFWAMLTKSNLFCHFWEMMRHYQIGNTIVTFCKSSQTFKSKQLMDCHQRSNTLIHPEIQLWFLKKANSFTASIFTDIILS